MNDYKKWLDNFSIGVKFPSVSGFEILEMLQARSHLAQFENSMNATELAELESADALSWRMPMNFIRHSLKLPISAPCGRRRMHALHIGGGIWISW